MVTCDLWIARKFQFSKAIFSKFWRILELEMKILINFSTRKNLNITFLDRSRNTKKSRCSFSFKPLYTKWAYLNETKTFWLSQNSDISFTQNGIEIFFNKIVQFLTNLWALVDLRFIINQNDFFEQNSWGSLENRVDGSNQRAPGFIMKNNYQWCSLKFRLLIL